MTFQLAVAVEKGPQGDLQRAFVLPPSNGSSSAVPRQAMQSGSHPVNHHSLSTARDWCAAAGRARPLAVAKSVAVSRAAAASPL
jgi:hypothetical protein